ncbi:MAG: hypothetical protein LBR83_10905 [Clostridiales bacterium]|nr:hypothetical protein [Clostridiales bacterium]
MDIFQKNARSGMLLNQRLIIYAALIIIAALVGVIIWLSASGTEKTLVYEDNVTIGEMPGVDREALLAQLQEKMDESAIAFSINARPTIVNTTASIFYENPSGNGKDVILSIVDGETGETIYESNLIREGSYIDYITLTREYAPGEYEATAYLTAYNRETREQIGKAAAGLTLEVIDSTEGR